MRVISFERVFVAEPAASTYNVCIFWSNACLLFTKGRRVRRSLTFSGSNQARKGRLVDALAVRGDERRDTLR